jgi:hypothetical protein
MKWLTSVKTAIQQLRAINNSLNEYRKQQEARRGNAEHLLKSVSQSAKARFSDEVLLNLLDAGWHEGRAWDDELLSEFQSRFTVVPPPTALEVLREFGGLDIGLSGRMIQIGEITERLCSFRGTLIKLVGPTLYPIGETNIFEDDGLGVHIDEAGQVFVDGATGHDPPNDYRIELIASGFDAFLNCVFRKDREGPIPMLNSWTYTESGVQDEQNGT